MSRNDWSCVQMQLACPALLNACCVRESQPMLGNTEMTAQRPRRRTRVYRSAWQPEYSGVVPRATVLTPIMATACAARCNPKHITCCSSLSLNLLRLTRHLSSRAGARWHVHRHFAIANDPLMLGKSQRADWSPMGQTSLNHHLHRVSMQVIQSPAVGLVDVKTFEYIRDLDMR